MMRVFGAAALAAMLALPAAAQGTLKVGIVTVLSGPQATLGQQLRDGFALGVKLSGGRLGGLATEMLVVDDELKPDVAVTRVRALVERDEVPVIVGPVFSNIMAAIQKPAVDGGAILISPNAGPSTFAGRGCNASTFVTSYQNDQVHAVMGEAANTDGYRRVFVMVPNYQAGRDAAAGFKRTFKGEVVEEVYVPLNQLDFSAELAKIAAAKPDAIFTFMPGGLGINLVRQYRQAGLANIPFLSTFTVDESTLPATQDAAVGFYSAADWAPNMDNPANRRFVQAFEAEYGYVPASYAAHAFDTAILLDAAIKAAGGVTDKEKLRAAIRSTPFESVRGPFRFGVNNFPVQDFWLLRVAKRADGKFQTETVRRVFEANVDAYASECRMR